MGLSIGIIGLPNVGKSTVFNALTGAQQAVVANYPFCTIKPNRAIVPVPDNRVDLLANLVQVPHIYHATVEFVDIAGLVKGASQGEGLGNQFLGNIRDTDAILHIVRCFDDTNVVHINEKPEPKLDTEIINLELILADLQQLERRIQHLESDVKGDRTLLSTLDIAHKLEDYLHEGKRMINFPEKDNDDYIKLVRELRFLTSKPMIYLANTDENGLAAENVYVQELIASGKEEGIEILVLCAQLEADIIDLNKDEQKEFLLLAGVENSSLDLVVRKSFELLSLISFFTKNSKEVRAWEIEHGSPAPKAAGKIHTDFERGFIRAEVVPFDTFAKYETDAAVKAAGKMRLEGKDYIVQDGDIIYFRFNV